MPRTEIHHGTALRSEPWEATGLNVGPAAPEHKAHDVHRPPPPLPPGVRWVPKQHLPAPRGNKGNLTSPRSSAHCNRRGHWECKSNKRRKATPQPKLQFLESRRSRRGKRPDNPEASGSFVAQVREFRAQSGEAGTDSGKGAGFPGGYVPDRRGLLSRRLLARTRVAAGNGGKGESSREEELESEKGVFFYFWRFQIVCVMWWKVRGLILDRPHDDGRIELWS